MQTAPGGAGRAFFVGMARCRTCVGAGAVPCPKCAVEETYLRDPDPTGAAWSLSPAPGSRRHMYFQDDAACWEGLPRRVPPPPAPGKKADSLTSAGWMFEDGIPEHWPKPFLGKRPRSFVPGDALNQPLRSATDPRYAPPELLRAQALWERLARWAEPKGTE